MYWYFHYTCPSLMNSQSVDFITINIIWKKLINVFSVYFVKLQYSWHVNWLQMKQLTFGFNVLKRFSRWEMFNFDVFYLFIFIYFICYIAMVQCFCFYKSVRSIYPSILKKVTNASAINEFYGAGVISCLILRNLLHIKLWKFVIL